MAPWGLLKLQAPGFQPQLGSLQPRLLFHPISYRLQWPRHLPWLQTSRGPSLLQGTKEGQFQWPQAGPLASGSFLWSRLAEGALKPKLWLTPAHWCPWPKAVSMTPGCQQAVYPPIKKTRDVILETNVKTWQAREAERPAWDLKASWKAR